jgi:hypothetical protein
MAARHCQWRWRGAARFVYIRSKRAIGSDAFRKNNETRHCQLRDAIRIFKILSFSLLFLIILI